MSSVLECSSNLSGVQSKLKFCFSVGSFGYRVVLKAKRQKIIIVSDLKIWTTKCARTTFVSSSIKRRGNDEIVMTFKFLRQSTDISAPVDFRSVLSSSQASASFSLPIVGD